MRSILLAGLASTLLLTPTFAENLFENGSFEFPKTTGKTAVDKGGSPARTTEATSWTAVINDPVKSGGNLVAGITDEIAHTGKQSIFVDFQKLSAKNVHVAINSNLIPVKAEQKYRISIWGKLDKERPLTMDQRRARIRAEIQFFAEDQETQLGDTKDRVQMLPGSMVPGLKPRLLFVSNQWNEFATELRSPQQAAFIKVAFYFESGTADGETDGLLFLDDAVLEGDRGTIPLTDKEESEDPSAPTPAAPGTATQGAPKPAAVPAK